MRWPGFTPLATPLAIFDGDSTLLFRHPSPPPPYRTTTAGRAAMAGRDSAVTANSSALVGGVVTATLMIDQSSRPFDPPAWAAVALHETFHAFQRAHHPSWAGNEGDLLRYPFDNATALALRRLGCSARAFGATCC